MIKRFKIWLLNWVIKDLWNGITEDDVLQMRGAQLWENGKPAGQGRVQELSSGCKAIRSIPTHDTLMREMKMAANRKMYTRSSSIEDIIFGKAVLWTIDVYEKKLYNLSNLDVKRINREEE